MTYRQYTPATPATPAFGMSWIVFAPWAHPVWHSYVVLLYDLTTEIPDQPAPVLYLDGATHELMVFALDPSHPAEPPVHTLAPANHGYQFRADSNEAARDRVVALLEMIAAGTLSPDTDYRLSWDARFADGVSLLQAGGAS